MPGQASPLEQISTSGSSPRVDLLLADQSRNTRGIVQLSSGSHQYQLVNYTDYDAYGNPITESAGSVEAGGLTTSQTGLNANYVGSTPWGFGEGYTDATGLVYLVHRYYDPVTGQFVSVDPLVAVTNAPYGYGSDNPQKYVDPTGQSGMSTYVDSYDNGNGVAGIITVVWGPPAQDIFVQWHWQVNASNTPDKTSICYHSTSCGRTPFLAGGEAWLG